MKNVIAIVLFSTFSITGGAQYYYSDILGTKQTNQLYKLIKSYQYKKINAVSFEGSQPSKDFLLQQEILDDGARIVTRSASIGNSESYFTGYYQTNKISRTVDSGNNAINTVAYEYDRSGRIASINSNSKDFDGTDLSSESHTWTYDEQGLPVRMLKIKNQTDTTLVTFAYDEQGNVAEEKWTKNNRVLETYYYYYNSRKQLTDIVRFNRKAKTMLPDYVFEYDNPGRIVQMIQTQSGNANYLIWRYAYNENGMKEKELVYNKQKELLGSIVYSYQQ